jgi:glutathione S-transferase
MATITLYTNKMSRGRIVQWMLEELGEPYDVQYVEYGPKMKSSEYLSINPMGKVPALKHGDAIVTETPAILAYLADAFPQKDLIPPHGSAARAAFFRWLFFTAGPLEAATTAHAMAWVTPEKTLMGTGGKGFLGYGSIETTLNTLENQLKQNTYICGEQFTAADVYLASHLIFGTSFVKAYEPRAVFDEYTKRMLARPAKQCADAL